MALLHRIELACGPDGEDGDRLVFDAGRVNLIVGPNNAGKSLLLRELAGFNPRDRERRVRAWDRTAWLPGTILHSATYVEGIQADVDERVKRAVLKPEDAVGAALSARPLREVMTVLRQNEDEVRQVVAAIEDLLPKSPLPGVPQGMVSMMRAMASQLPALAVLFSQAALQSGSGVQPSLRELAEQILSVVGQRAVALLQRAGVDVALPSIVVPSEDELLQSAADSMDGRSVQNPRVQQALELGSVVERLLPWLLDASRWGSLLRDLEDKVAEFSWGESEAPTDLRQSVVFLDGMARLELTRAENLKPWEHDQRGIVGRLLDDHAARDRLRRLVHEGLGLWLVIDQVTDAPTVLFRLSRTPPADPLWEQRRDADTAAFMAAAADLRDRSDGTVAYIGLLAAIIATGPKMVCIDEPEAFLHPPLARTLARQLTQLARERDIQLFVATHSADFVAGCVTADPETRILRLTFDGDQGRARRLDGDVLRSFSLDPAMRSNAALGGLFASAVVVVEADTDRAFYQEIHERLADHVAEQGHPRPDGWVFMNTGGWQGMVRLVGPLRAMGIPTVVIIDSDGLSGKESLTDLLRTAGVPDGVAEGWRLMAATLKPDEPGRKGGYPKSIDIRTMPSHHRKTFGTLLTGMAEYGIFVVPVGELEDWLGGSVRVAKPRWLEHAFRHLGADPSAPGYVRPDDGDVWAFMRSIDEWVRSQRASA
jgi:energy-coupling factor transporter ATP-binding protein EcfA2